MCPGSAPPAPGGRRCTRARPPANSTQRAIVNDIRPHRRQGRVGPARRQGDPGDGRRQRRPRLHLPDPGAPFEDRRHAERGGEETRGVDGVTAGAGDDHLVHLPGRQRGAHGRQLGGRPRRQRRPPMLRSVRIRRAEPGAPSRPVRPSTSGVLSAAPASRKRMPCMACHSIGCAEPETAKGTVSTTSPAGGVSPHRAGRAGCAPARRERRVEGHEDRRQRHRCHGDGGDTRQHGTVSRQPRGRAPVCAVQPVETDCDQEGQEQRHQRHELVGQDLLSTGNVRGRARAARDGRARPAR